MKEENPPADGGALALRLSWAEAEQVRMTFADQLLIQAQGDYVLLTIGQASPPPIATADDPLLDVIRQRGAVSVLPVARIAVTPLTAAKFARAFNQIASMLPAVPDEP